jgi:predicted anti-sigma-YlaC factor YlaD
MQCAQIRVALSAITDGEEPGVGRAEVAAHLAGCEECRAWRSAARDVTEGARAGWASGAEVPDLTAQVLAAVASDRAASAARRPAKTPVVGFAHPGVLRWALGISAVAQMLLALPSLVADPTSGNSALHAGREMASFDVAVAIGFLFVAARPAWARALVPVAVALSGCLLLTSTIDVSDGAAQFGHELNHLLAGVQAGLLWWLARANRTLLGPETYSGGGAPERDSRPGGVRVPR